jgi:TPP-dependent pyruvate/acetoin dehydrogenase alpha subunit
MPDLRPVAELEAWKRKCPVAGFQRILLKNRIASKQELEVIDTQVMQQIDDSVNYALASPLPAPEDALEDVFSV